MSTSTPSNTTSPQRYEDGLGGSITILEPGDAIQPMRFRMIMPKGFGPPAPERHPSQQEEFYVHSGELDLGVVDGKRIVLRTGDRYTLPVGAFHKPANPGDTPVEIEAVLRPGLDAAQLFAELYTETRCHKGLGQFARVAMVFRRYPETMSFKLPVRVVMTLVAGVARLLGVRSTPVESPVAEVIPFEARQAS